MSWVLGRLPITRSKPSTAILFQPRISHHCLTCVASPARHDEPFTNTSQRWIYVKFNRTELQRVAAEAIQEDFCPDIVKLAEGGFNKDFLRSKNGCRAIARIPTPIVGPPRYATASEVATMNFLRSILKVPVPKVLGYSTTPETPVGAEYIIMERVDGESLASRWTSLRGEGVKDIMKQMAEMERKVFTYTFPGYVSLHHRNDIEGEPQIPVPVDDICVGPIAGCQFWHGTSSLDCMTSAARREVLAFDKQAKAQPRGRFLLPTPHDIDPSEQTSLLSTTPILRHPDMTLSNTLLVPGTTQIASIVDWQDTIIFPPFLQAGYPAFSKPQLRMEQANLYYTAATGLHNDAHMDTLRIPHLRMRQYLFKQTGYPWDADFINLRAALVGITRPQIWEAIKSGPCPVHFTESEREAALEEAKEWNESEEVLSAVRNHLGIDLEGGTEPENYEWASHANVQFRLKMLRQTEEGQRALCWRNWPYKDDEDDNSPPPL
ncbi:hypothetical protein BDW59DRAFT_179223 [Aspergillus cavernicola]|uniref:Altered inheritance of mitochondria protein 9, mitochondrial n=1 Tax=Aspergillus cavernicola TaxID=176166 RepID=A0ABR4IHM1_9EURO